MWITYSEMIIKMTRFPSHWNNKHILYKQAAYKRYIKWFVLINEDSYRKTHAKFHLVCFCNSLYTEPLTWGSLSTRHSLIKPHNGCVGDYTRCCSADFLQMGGLRDQTPLSYSRSPENFSVWLFHGQTENIHTKNPKPPGKPSLPWRLSLPIACWSLQRPLSRLCSITTGGNPCSCLADQHDPKKSLTGFTGWSAMC